MTDLFVKLATELTGRQLRIEFTPNMPPTPLVYGLEGGKAWPVRDGARPLVVEDVSISLSTRDNAEVMHVRTDWLGGEHGVSWFFHAVGSGVFLDCKRLPRDGRIAVFKDRLDWCSKHGNVDWVMDENVLGAMERDGASLYIFTAAGFSVFGQAGNNPSTEIIVVRRAFP